VDLTGWSSVGRNVQFRAGDSRFPNVTILAGLLVVGSTEDPEACRRDCEEHTCRNQQGF
jgi:hypothetical protein